MPDWNHNGRRDLFDSFIDYEIINGSDDDVPYAKRTRTPSISDNERRNGIIRYIIRDLGESDCLGALKAIDVYLASEWEKDPRHLWGFGLDLETAEMLNDLRKACAEELRKKGPAFTKEAEEDIHRQVLKYEAEKLMRSRRLEEQKREKARKAARRKERLAYIFNLGWLRKR